VLQYLTVRYSVLKCAVVCCSVLHLFSKELYTLKKLLLCCSVLQSVAVCCSVLQYVAVCCVAVY